MNVELVYQSVGRSQAHRRDQYRNSRRSGAISLSVNRRRISTIGCLFRSQAYWYESLYGYRSSVYWYKEMVVIFRVRQG